MACCGQRRAAAAAAAQSPQLSARSNHFSFPLPVATPTEPATGKRRLVRYIGARPLSLRGPLSGHVYYFAAADATANVDERDIDAMLRTQLFVRDNG